MKEQLIGFETAKLAKEKGFDIPCNEHCFIGNTGKIVFEKSVHCIDWGNRPNVKTIQKYSRPTQALLQKWLRETHNLHITLFSSSQESWMFRITEPHQKLEEGLYGEDYYTYEEALEEGLQEALKSINT